MASIFVRKPKLGDYVCRRISDRKEFYLDWQNPATPLTATFEYEGDTYETFANAVPCKEGVLHVWKETEEQTWCDRYEFTLTGYTLDGTDRTGTISIKTSSSASTDTDFVVSYNATTLEGLAAQLNAFFADTEVFAAQDWYARVEGETIRVDFAFTFWQQANNSAKNGFTFTWSILREESLATTLLRRKNGQPSGEGAISNWYKALAYFRADNSTASYNPETDLVKVKMSYPICLPAYLGTSQHRDSDHCAFLRSVYGEGEEGWIKFMKSFLPVFPIDSGTMSMDFGKEMTALLASKRYSSRKKTDEVLCKAAYYAHERESQTVSKGEFYLPTARELAILLRDVKFSAAGDRNSDPLNAARNKIGWGSINNSSSLWSCCRYNSNYAWCARGGYGFFYGGDFYSGYRAVPVSLQKKS